MWIWVSSALSTFTVTAAVASGQAEAVAGLLAVLGGGIAAATRIGVGVHADHSSRAHLVVVATMLGIGTSAYLMLALSAGHLPGLLLPGIILAYAAGWGWNGLFNLAITTKYPAQAARATGITAVGGRTGGVIGPLVFGIVAAHGSYTLAWLLTAAAAAIATLIILFGYSQQNNATTNREKP